VTGAGQSQGGPEPGRTGAEDRDVTGQGHTLTPVVKVGKPKLASPHA
jgi:hypothetical protein